jgi:hypothetical protein
MQRSTERSECSAYGVAPSVAWSTSTKVATLSTESIASPTPSADVVESCAACAAPLADDQRYCLECGERRAPMSSVLLGGPPVSGDPQLSSTTPPAPFPAQGASVATGAGQRGNTVTVIAGVGVLLLAMGVGVLIGRSGNSKPAAAPAQEVISVAQPGATTTGTATATTPTTPEASAKGASPSSKPGAKKGAAPGAGSSKGGGGAKNAPPATPKPSSSGQGKSYEEKSKNLPNVVETG